MSIIEINKGNYGEHTYAVFVGTGTACLQEFRVYAYSDTEAVDIVADFCEKYELSGLYADHYEIADLCDAGETVDEYAEAHNLTCCGNHGVYMNIVNIVEKTCMNEPVIAVSKSAHGTVDVVVYDFPSIKMVEFFSLLDIWGSKGYDRFEDGGLYFEVPNFVYDIVDDLPFIRTNNIRVAKR